MKKIKHLKSILIPTVAAASLAATVSTAVVLTQANKNNTNVVSNLNAVTQHTITFSSTAKAYNSSESKWEDVGTATLTGSTAVKIKDNKTFGSVAHPTATLDQYTFQYWGYQDGTTFTEQKALNRIKEDVTLYPIFVTAEAPYINSDQCWISVADSKNGYAQLDFMQICNPTVDTITAKYTKTDGTEGTYSKARTEFNEKIEFGRKMTILPPSFLEGCTAYNQAITIPSNILIISDYFLCDCTAFNSTVTIANGLKYISSYFMAGCTAYNADIAIPNSVKFVNGGFMNNCNAFHSTLDLTSYSEDIDFTEIFADDNYTLASSDPQADLYTLGVKISTKHTLSLQTFLGWLPNESGKSTESYQCRNLGLFVNEWDPTTSAEGTWKLYICNEGPYIAGLITGKSWPSTNLPTSVSYKLDSSSETYETKDVMQLASGALSDDYTKTLVPSTLTIPYGSDEEYRYVPASCFSGCTNLTSITYTYAPTVIGPSAFAGSGITTIDIHAATGIGDNAFNDCSALSAITINEALYTSKCGVGESAFKGIADTGTITVQTAAAAGVTLTPTSWGLMAALLNDRGVPELVASGATASQWNMACTGTVITGVLDPSTFVIENGVLIDLGVEEPGSLPSTTNTLIIPAEVESIGDSCALLKEYSTITTVLFEEGSKCTKIGDWSMTSSALTTVNFENATNLVEIGDGSFADCIALTSIKIYSTVTTMGKNAFLGCSTLAELDLSDYSALPQWATDMQTYEDYEGILYSCASIGNVKTANATIQASWYTAFTVGGKQGVSWEDAGTSPQAAWQVIVAA